MARGSAFLKSLKDDPATKELMKNLSGFATAKAGDVATGLVNRVAGGDKEMDKDEEGNPEPDTAAGGAVQGVTEAKQEGKSGLLGGIKGALKGLFKRGGSAKRPTNIYEQIFIGVPVEQAYANWIEYSNFPEFMKGPESVKVNKEEGEDGEVKETHQWTAKIFLNRRSWKATIEEDVENRRIRWTTEAAKGTIDGAISFTPIGDNATLMVYTLEYRPKGFFEWWGNRWRTVGRRARLDVKHFGRYVMMQDQTDDEEENGEEEEPDEEIAEDKEPGEGPVVEPEGEGQDEDDEADEDVDTDETDAAPATEPAAPGEEAESDTDTEPESADEAEAEPEPVRQARHQPRTPRRQRGESQ